MTTLFITWPIAQDTAFRVAYTAVTDEHIQATPQTHANGLFFMVGSTRLTAATAEALCAQFGTHVRYASTPAVLNWVDGPVLE